MFHSPSFSFSFCCCGGGADKEEGTILGVKVEASTTRKGGEEDRDGQNGESWGYNGRGDTPCGKEKIIGLLFFSILPGGLGERGFMLFFCFVDVVGGEGRKSASPGCRLSRKQIGSVMPCVSSSRAVPTSCPTFFSSSLKFSLRSLASGEG